MAVKEHTVDVVVTKLRDTDLIRLEITNLITEKVADKAKALMILGKIQELIELEKSGDTDDHICCICGFNISQKERDEPDHLKRGRSWAQSFEFGEVWICGGCGDDLKDRLNED